MANGQTRYSVGYDERTARFFQGRTADTHARFLLEYLVPGMDLLDGGCGPGTITKGLAEIVAPGRVVGVDREQSQIDLARCLTAGSPTIEFRIDDLCSLTADDESFDVVFVHGVLEHIADPEKAISEIHRVLRPGGLAGARHADFGGFLLEPTPEPLGQFSQLFIELMKRNGGDPYCGRRQPGLFREAGFEIAKVSASYDCWTPDADSTRSNAHFLSELCGDSEFADQLVEYGLADKRVLGQLKSAFLMWGEMPEAFAAEAWGEIVARKA
ncbi:MAG: methyltransferase domain-containing protein [Gemmatimonadota bacterium]|nr:methyltransferase domain-containing protein [Gemmatimonadota bacterium]